MYYASNPIFFFGVFRFLMCVVNGSDVYICVFLVLCVVVASVCGIHTVATGYAINDWKEYTRKSVKSVLWHYPRIYLG
jgi:hypothetical protein